MTSATPSPSPAGGSEHPVLLEFDGPLAIATLNRPASLNTIDLATAQALCVMALRVAERAAAKGDVRVLLLRGAGRGFCSGGDVQSMQAHAHELPDFIGRIIDAFHLALMALARLPVPVISAVHGVAAGGGFSLALAADQVVAGRAARFVVAYPQLGTSTDGGLSHHLTRQLGPARALALLARPAPIAADEAERLGLVHAVVDDAQVWPHALQLARQWVALPAIAVRELRGLVHAPSLDAFETHLHREREAFLRCAATPEFAARVASFAARVAPAAPVR